MDLGDDAEGALHAVRWEAEQYPPIDLMACVVPFDPRAGCAVSIERHFTGERSLIGFTFVTECGQDLPHDITVGQAETLVLTVSEAIRQARAGG